MPAAWAAAEDERVVELVCIPAFVLEPGTSMSEWMGGDFPPTWIHSDDGLAVKAGDAEQAIFSGVDPALTAEAVKRFNRQGMGLFTQKLGAASTGTTPTYIVATEDPTLPPAVQEEWATRAAPRAHVPSGRSPHLSHRDEVAEVLAEAVTRAAADV